MIYELLTSVAPCCPTLEAESIGPTDLRVREFPRNGQ